MYPCPTAGKIVSHALQYGYLTNFKIENMHEQFLSRQAQGEGLKKQAAAEAADTGNEFTYAAVDNDRGSSGWRSCRKRPPRPVRPCG